MINNETIEHLKLIQNVVWRVSRDGAQMKTWAVSLVSAIFVFSGLSDDPQWFVPLGGLIPVVAFWYMDARYLHIERSYIALYNAVLEDNENVEHFSLNYKPFAKKNKKIRSFSQAFWSWSTSGFYGALFILMLIQFAVVYFLQ